MIASYGLTAAILFLVHITLKDKYRNSITRCAFWALFWPLDVAVCLWEFRPRDGGEVNTAALLLKMRDEK
jgi:hypothetical protein